MEDRLIVRKDGILFRFADREDKDNIYEFSLAAIAGADLPEFASDAGADLQNRIEQGDPNNVLLAEDKFLNNIIVGYVELDPRQRSHKKTIYIRGIFVLPEYRRRGIGKDLLKIIRKHKTGELRVDAFTQQGLKFWENYGFKIHHFSLFHNPDEN